MWLGDNLKKIIIIVVVLVLVFASIGLISNNSNLFSLGKNNKVKIGYIGPLTGPVANIGISVKNSIDLANYQNNNIFEIIYEDGKWKPVDAVNAAKKLIEIDNIDIIISGACSSSILAIAPLTEENKIIHITPVAGSPLVAKSGEYVYRVSTSSDVLAANTAKVVYEKGARKVGVIFELNDYPVGWKQVFKREFEKLGGKVIIEEGFTFGSNDTKIQLIKLNAQDIDSIVMSTVSATSAIKLAKESKELGIEKRLIGAETFTLTQTIRNAKSNLDGFFAADYSYPKKSKQFQQFVLDYNVYTRNELLEELFGAIAYDMYDLLLEGVNVCGKDSLCIKSYFDNAGKRSGVAGEYYFDEDGSAIREVVLRKFENGKFILVN